MKTIDKVINKKIFVNAFAICKSYATKNYVKDINILLLKNSYTSITEKNIEKYYDKFIVRDKFYFLPELFTNTIVQIPKGINGFREYRFFDIYSMVLYNAIGLIFVSLCKETIEKLNFDMDQVFTYAPTKFRFNQNEKWEATNDYAEEYTKYTKRIKENIENGDVIIKLDLSNYFDSIKHDILINSIKTFSIQSTLSEFEFDENSVDALKFYFHSMMGKKTGIPQGRENCISDYYGDLYLKSFDLSVKRLCEDDFLQYKCMIRYVDDFIIVFKPKKIDEKRKIFKKLSNIEHKISKYFFRELGLNINNNKTIYEIIEDKKELTKFLNKNNKKVSSKEEKIEGNSTNKIKKNYLKFKSSLEKFKFHNKNKFDFKLNDEDRENLKLVFLPSFQNYLKKEDVKKDLSASVNDIDFELTIDSMYILIALFFIKSGSDKIFYDSYNSYLKANFNFADKRAIHILMLGYTQMLDGKFVKKFIKRNKEQLICDNYGKYLLIISGDYRYRDDILPLSNTAIFNKLAWEYQKQPSKYLKKFLPKSNEMYYLLVDKIVNNNSINDAQIEQLKNFVCYYIQEDWDLAFNSFYNFFHESCKNKFKNKSNDYNINNMIKDLYKNNYISLNDEIILKRFSDARNFNAISHPSKNGKKSIKVNYNLLSEFLASVEGILIKIL